MPSILKIKIFFRTNFYNKKTKIYHDQTIKFANNLGFYEDSPSDILSQAQNPRKSYTDEGVNSENEGLPSTHDYIPDRSLDEEQHQRLFENSALCKVFFYVKDNSSSFNTIPLCSGMRIYTFYTSRSSDITFFFEKFFGTVLKKNDIEIKFKESSDKKPPESYEASIVFKNSENAQEGKYDINDEIPKHKKTTEKNDERKINEKLIDRNKSEKNKIEEISEKNIKNGGIHKMMEDGYRLLINYAGGVRLRVVFQKI